MGGKTGINWCDATWNPVIGCSKVSPGCDNCYAEQMASRFVGEIEYENGESVDMFGAKVINNGKWNGKTVWRNTKYQPPISGKPKTIFVCSMGDLFHESVPFEWVDDVLFKIYTRPQHHFMVLTKRPERMKEYFDDLSVVDSSSATSERFRSDFKSSALHGLHMRYLQHNPLQNLAIGVTVENQKTFDERLPILLTINAEHRFLSAEPLIESIDFDLCQEYPDDDGVYADAREGIDLVIVGGESGKRARPMKEQWVHSIRGQCLYAGVPLHFKQWGKKSDGRLINGEQCNGAINWGTSKW